MILRRCLATLLLFVPVTTAAQLLQVIEVRVDGRVVDTVVSIFQFAPPQRTRAPLQVQAGQVLSDGVEIGVPARTVVVVQTANGNRIELAPDSRYSGRVGAAGEVHTMLAGSGRFDVQRALSFFNVEFNRFVALVRGTAFQVEAGLDGEGALNVQRGRVAVQREVPTLLGDVARQVDMLEQEILDAESRSQRSWPAAEALRRYEKSEQALTQYGRALTEAEERKDRDGQMAALNNLGLTWLARGEPGEALAYFKRMLAMAQREQDEPWRARALNNLGAAALEQGTPSGLQDAVKYLEDALAANRALDPQSAQRRIAQVEGNLGLAWRRLGDLSQARDYTLRSLGANRELAQGRDSAALARNLESMGNLENDPALAAEYHLRALQMRERLYGDSPHPELASSLMNMGLLATRAGDDRGAAEHYGRAVTLLERLFGEKADARLATALVRHGSALCRGGDIDAGLAQNRRALAMRRDLSRVSVDNDVIESYQQIAACWAIASRLGEPGAKARMTETLRSLEDYKTSSGSSRFPGTY